MLALHLYSFSIDPLYYYLQMKMVEQVLRAEHSSPMMAEYRYQARLLCIQKFFKQQNKFIPPLFSVLVSNCLHKFHNSERTALCKHNAIRIQQIRHQAA